MYIVYFLGFQNFLESVQKKLLSAGHAKQALFILVAQSYNVSLKPYMILKQFQPITMPKS